MKWRVWGIAGTLAGALIGSTLPAIAADDILDSSHWDGHCADVVFIGARGSGETRPYGSTVERMHTALTSRLPAGTSVTSIFVEYPAATPYTLGTEQPQDLLLASKLPSNAYFRSVTTGGTELRRVLAQARSSCPGTPVLVAGFSQGAEIVSTALGSGDPDLTDIAAIVVAGDPANAPDRAAQADAQSPTGAAGLSTSLTYLRQAGQDAKEEDGKPMRGILQAVVDLDQHRPQRDQLSRALTQMQVVLPPSAYERMFSVCLPGDLVCDAGPSMAKVLLKTTTLREEIDAARPLHMGYTDEVMQRTYDAAGTRWSQALARHREAKRQAAVPSPGAAWWPTFGLGALAGIATSAVISVLLRRKSIRSRKTP